ncbi:MAG: lysylphosphatidylglycerol synthase transmembrane domain-containing protein [Saprospiraceae bacterium]|nr:lysylphosphatidylglycerol synthase transmembrane domain-containing protein [Saprospiraceae bacterium]
MEAILSTYRQNKLFGPILNILIVMLFLVALYYQVFARQDLLFAFQTFQTQLEWAHLPWLILALGLMPVNWAFETFKWLQFTRSFSKMRFWQSYQAVLAGVAMSLITPNRIGEYGGRVLLTERRHTWRIVVATLLGSISQMIVLFSVGLVGFLWFSYNHLVLKTYLLFGVGVLGLGFILTLIIIFFRIQAIIPIIYWLAGKQMWKRIRKQIIVLRMCNDQQKLQAIAWALLRYLTYCVQYWLLLHFLRMDVPILDAFAAIATIFLIQTGFPLPPIGALLARAEIALYIWGYFNVHEISVLAATFGLFIINLALPALLGAIFIVITNIKKSPAYEKIAV